MKTTGRERIIKKRNEEKEKVVRNMKELQWEGSDAEKWKGGGKKV